MTTRTQDSPFRETAWDQRLDKMLDDLKSVTPDGERTSSRRDNSLASSFRSTSRSESRNSNRSGIEDGGLMKHQHKEYTSPDKSTRVVTDQFEYESEDPNKFQKKLVKSTYSNYKVSGDISSNLDSLRQGPDPAIMAAARSSSDYQTTDTKVVSASQKVANKLVDALSTIGPSNSCNTNSYSKTSKYSTSGMTNGKPSYDDDDAEMINDSTGGEVRKIVWRNRFDKTYEGHDGTPSISIEEEARRRNQKHYEKTTNSTISTFQPQPPQLSPGSQSWADPIPMPTPPQVSPKGEPGVAYVYTYGQTTNSQVQHLPPLNYVNMPSGASVPPSEGAPSPTPSGTQPIIYHYSYHYTLQPGQTVPEGIPQHPGGGHPPQPALQVAPAPSVRSPADIVPVRSGPLQSSTLNSSSSHDYKKHTSRTVDRNEVTNVHHHHHHPPGGTVSGPSEPSYPRETYDEPNDTYPRGREPINSYPRGNEPGGTYPSDGPNRNINISINKTTSHVTHTKDYPPMGPSTSTPFPTPGRSRSSSPDRYPRGPGSHPYGTVTHISRSSYSDSLDRVRRPPNEGLPFPDTSPIKSKENNKIPRRVDDLMTSFSDTEDGPNRGPLNGRGIHGPRSPPEREPLIVNNLNSNSCDLSLSESRRAELKKEETKNVAGPPVYYPPGHNQLFDESMHTMTLKENKRRGMAKWRMEKASGYKESSSSSDSKGGMAMVPVCLPLCCGAACAIM